MSTAITILAILLFVLVVAYFAVDIYIGRKMYRRKKPGRQAKARKKREEVLNFEGDTILEMPSGFKVMPDGQIVLMEM